MAWMLTSISCYYSMECCLVDPKLLNSWNMQCVLVYEVFCKLLALHFCTVESQSSAQVKYVPDRMAPAV